METSQIDKKRRAKKRVEELKGFYWHLAVYVVINAFITINKIIRNTFNGESFSEAFWDFGTFAIWLFWGVGLAFHAAKVFNFNPFFGKDWEKRQIQKYMDESRVEADKYKRMGNEYEN